MAGQTTTRMTRLQTTAQQEQALSRFSSRNKNSSDRHLEIIQVRERGEERSEKTNGRREGSKKRSSEKNKK